MKKILIISFLISLFSCTKKNENSIQSVTVNQSKHIKDSIRNAQEQEVINMDLSSKADDSLQKDLSKFK